jgi:hypothetical protein
MPQDVNHPVDTLQITSIDALHHWDEGHEELEFIPHSFAVVLKDGQGLWSMYADSEDEKVRYQFSHSQITGGDTLVEGRTAWVAASSGKFVTLSPVMYFFILFIYQMRNGFDWHPFRATT